MHKTIQRDKDTIEPNESTMQPLRWKVPSVIEDLAFCVPFESLCLACVLLKIGEPIVRTMMMIEKRRVA